MVSVYGLKVTGRKGGICKRSIKEKERDMDKGIADGE